MTWVCSTIARLDGSPTFAGYARHGLRFVETMIDLRNGMPHWETDLCGYSIGRHSGEIHAYGLAFAIFALANVARLPDSGAEREMAQQLFAWLDTYHRDPVNGGYHEVTRSNGAKVLHSGLRHRTDAIGGSYGLKSSNTHIHLLEAFVALSAIWPDARVVARINELIDVLTSRFWLEPGRIAWNLRSDWSPAAEAPSFGHAIELSHLILAAAAVVGRKDDSWLIAKAKALVDTALTLHWASMVGLPDNDSSVRTWWVQAEGLAGLAGLFRTTGDERYRALLIRHWTWVRAHQLDGDYGGWLETVSPDGALVGDGRKGWAWKDCYHEVRALLAAAEALSATDWPFAE